ncbi:MAG TPA: large conductance mechanosensitive channel protein MscL [Candidatus Eisenbacteria bacterium]|nr:large conductance mechanosensitive channel protein MscL [Candidatus Eisenbacteria bacterium]
MANPVPFDPTKRAASFLEEFKAFALKGNVVDLAVAVVIGGAFGKIVDSFVKNIVMPLISLVIPGDQAYVNWKFVAGEKEIPYGLFLGEVVNFILVAFAIFILLVKLVGSMIKKRTTEAAEPPAPSAEVTLLTEIRDRLPAR